MKMKTTIVKSEFIEHALILVEELKHKQEWTDAERNFINSVEEMCDVINTWKETKHAQNQKYPNMTRK